MCMGVHVCVLICTHVCIQLVGVVRGVQTTVLSRKRGGSSISTGGLEVAQEH
jgi:hypothetical protein